jgi:tetratricopeptide (TPR) repeat protein
MALRNQAIEEYQAVLSQQPAQAEALYNLASQYMQSQDLDLAQPLLTQLTEHHPHHADGWYLQGRISERKNQPTQALHAYQQVIQENPEHSEAHYNLGFIYQQQGDQQQAIEHFQRVSQLKPHEAEAFFNLGVLFAGNQRLAEAEQAYQKGIALQPNSLEGHFNLGSFYEFHKKDLPQAQHHYKKYLDLGGKDPRVQQLLNQLGK